MSKPWKIYGATLQTLDATKRPAANELHGKTNTDLRPVAPHSESGARIPSSGPSSQARGHRGVTRPTHVRDLAHRHTRPLNGQVRFRQALRHPSTLPYALPSEYHFSPDSRNVPAGPTGAASCSSLHGAVLLPPNERTPAHKFPHGGSKDSSRKAAAKPTARGRFGQTQSIRNFPKTIVPQRVLRIFRKCLAPVTQVSGISDASGVTPMHVSGLSMVWHHRNYG